MEGLSDADNSQPRRGKGPTGSERSVASVVVVGIDGSDTSWDAFWWATGQADRMASRIVVAFVSPAVDTKITVASTFPGIAFDYAGVEQTVVDRADQLRRQLEDYAAEFDLPISFIHAYGDPKTELTRVAEEAGADIIVVGKSTKARHHLAGSLGRRLIGQRKAPIVVVVP